MRRDALHQLRLPGTSVAPSITMKMKQIVLIYLICQWTFTVSHALDTSQCIGALGMESGGIRDEDITASSSFDGASVGPHNARVRVERNGGAWCPRQQATHQPRDWLEVDLHVVHTLTAVEIQGRFGNGQGQEFAEHFLLEYWRDALGKWVRYKDAKSDEVLAGNSNTYLAEKRDLDPPILARRLRFLPYSHHRRTVCMRVEIYGCPWTEGIVSYSMPQGDQRGSGWQFYDATYDGVWDGNVLRQGLGQLIDAKLGPDNFKNGYYEHDRALGWVGWKNDSRQGQPVEIIFEFDTVRDFTLLSLYANNQFMREVQVFSEVQVLFSLSGRVYSGEPITYLPQEDRIFETPRNISVKLHHRVGRFVKLRLFFASRWILISEVSFRSEAAARNYTSEIEAELATSTASVLTPPQLQPEVLWGVGAATADSAHPQDPTTPPTAGDNQAYLAIVIGILVAVSFILAAAIFFMIWRHRHRKNLGSPLPAKSLWGSTASGSPRLHPHHHDPLMGVEIGSTAHAKLLSKAGSLPYAEVRLTDPSATAAGTANHLLHHAGGTSHTMGSFVACPEGVPLKAVEYQEPYHALRFSPYYSYSTLLLAGNGHGGGLESPDRGRVHHLASDTYDYAVPEVRSSNGAPQRYPSPPAASPPPPLLSLSDKDKDSLVSRNSSKGSQSTESPAKKVVPDRGELLAALRVRAENMVVPELPRHRLHLHTRIASGAFGTVYTAEAEGIPDYGATCPAARRLVAAKYLPHTSEKDRVSFYQEVRLLAALDDVNLSRVLAVCTAEEPFCVVLEYLEHGDLHQFLRTRRLVTDPNNHIYNTGSTGMVGGALGSRSNLAGKPGIANDDILSLGSLIYVAGQIASGMRYLEALNFVHRDLAARNVLVGKALQIKICDFGTDSDAYVMDYYRVDDQTLGLPIRWMAWESLLQGKYTTKSDVWAFAVTLWEILVMARQRPYAELSDEAVVQNVERLASVDHASYVSLQKPAHCPRDIYDLMCECWRKNPTERPTFREIHLFLQRKNLGYAPS